MSSTKSTSPAAGRSPSPTRRFTKAASTKAEKAMKAEKERKRAEEMRMLEERSRETKEREEMEKADTESKEYEREHARLVAEKKRRDREANDISSWEIKSQQLADDFERKVSQDSAWNKYITCSSRIDPCSESEVNTRISLWRDKDDHIDLDDTIRDCQEAEDIITDLDNLAAEVADKLNQKQLVDRCKKNIQELRELSQYKLDRMTANILQHADEYTTSTKASEVLLARSTPSRGLNYGLFVNLAKNPRLKTIDFSESTGITLEVPKNIALNTVGLRVIQYSRDYADWESELIPLGGIFHLELLTIPPPPKKVKGWTLRQVTVLSTQLSKLQFPLSGTVGEASNLGHSNSVGSIKVSMQVPPTALIRQDVPVVGWFNAESGSWKHDGITDVSFARETRILTFHTIHTAPHAILHNRYIDFPFDCWSLHSLSRNMCRLTLNCSRSGKEIEIDVSEGSLSCRITKPPNVELPEFSRGNQKLLGPALLLRKLSESGIEIRGDEKVLLYLQITGKFMPNVKDPALEKRVYAQMARVAGGFDFRPSKFNAHAGEKKCVILCKDPKAGHHVSTSTSTSSGNSPHHKEHHHPSAHHPHAHPHHDSHTPHHSQPHSSPHHHSSTHGHHQQEHVDGWISIELTEHKAIGVRSIESNEAYDDHIHEGGKDHSHLFHVLHEHSTRVSEEALKNARHTSPSFADTLQSLLEQISPMKFCTI